MQIGTQGERSTGLLRQGCAAESGGQTCGIQNLCCAGQGGSTRNCCRPGAGRGYARRRKLETGREAENHLPWMLERDDFSSNRHPTLSFCLSMISAQTRSAFVARGNRYPLFRIML